MNNLYTEENFYKINKLPCHLLIDSNVPVIEALLKGNFQKISLNLYDGHLSEFLDHSDTASSVLSALNNEKNNLNKTLIWVEYAFDIEVIARFLIDNISTYRHSSERDFYSESTVFNFIEALSEECGYTLYINNEPVKYSDIDNLFVEDLAKFAFTGRLTVEGVNIFNIVEFIKNNYFEDVKTFVTKMKIENIVKEF